jgi:hydrophobe/amphiphile efflux-3 (HAE3) family protein
VTHPAPAIAGVVSLVGIVGVVAVLSLSPDAGTDKLVDHGSSAYAGTQEFRERFGDDAIVVLAKGDLKKLVLTKDASKLLALEGCLAGNPPDTQQNPEFAGVASKCESLKELGAIRVVFGPATFLNQAATQAQQFVSTQYQSVQANAEAAGKAAIKRAAAAGLSPRQQAAAGQIASQSVLQQTIKQYGDLAATLSQIGAPGSPQFNSAIVFDSRQVNTPKSRFGYLFPSADGALISIRLEPDISNEDRREAISLIRSTVADPAFQISDTSYEISGIPVVVEGLADELGGQIVLLLGVALLVMALTLLVVFGPPLRLLPLFVALGGAAMAFGLLAILGGTLTMASVAVLPVVIGLGVDYAIQLQARFREATEAGERPPAAAVIAAIRGGPVIATAALATAVGFGSLILSPIPMVHDFAIALIAGIFSALAISVTAGLAALSMATGARRAPASGLGRRLAASTRLTGARDRFAALGARGSSRIAAARARASAAGQAALATAIAIPGRVLAVATLLAVVGWVAGTRTEVVSDIRALVPNDLPALQSVDELQGATGVSGELDVLVSGDDVTSPEAIAWMGDFKSRVLAENGFTGEFPNCRSPGVDLCPGPALPDLFVSGGPPNQERIDSVLAAVPQYFSQAILSRPDDGPEVASIAFLIPVMPLDEQEALISDIRSQLDPPDGIDAEVVGLPVLAADANAELSGSRYWLTLVGLFAVALVLLAVYREPARALVPLLPIALATGWSALLLEAMGVALNPMSATLGALVIAIATEFSVLLAARYYEEREAGRSIGDALRFTYSRTGIAVLASGITSIAGFGVLLVSGITMLRDFGLVTLVDLSVSLAGVMLVLPAALVWGEGGFEPVASRLRALRPARLGRPRAGGAG